VARSFVVMFLSSTDEWLLRIFMRKPLRIPLMWSWGGGRHETRNELIFNILSRTSDGGIVGAEN